MITGATKGKVDAIWQKMWEGGITNPIEVISQLTYLMFIRSLDEKELEAERMEQVLGVPQPRIFRKLTAMPMVRKSLEKNFVGVTSRTNLPRKCIAS